LFDQKFQKIEEEREHVRECEKKLLAQERELQRREAEMQKNFQEMLSQNSKAITDNNNDTSKFLPLLESWTIPQRQMEEKLNVLSHRLSKLDRLDEVMSRLDNWTASGGGMMGGHRVEKTNDTKRTAAEIKSEMESLHQIIMDEKASTKDREAANLKIDRLFIELASTDEYKAEIKRAHEEKNKNKRAT